MNIEFGGWLKSKLEEKNITQSELANMIGVHPPQISRIISGDRSTRTDTLIAIAHALKLSPITIFRKAGLLPTPANGDESIRFADWQFLLEQLTPEEEEELRQIAEMKIDRRQKSNSLKNLKHKKAG